MLPKAKLFKYYKIGKISWPCITMYQNVNIFLISTFLLIGKPSRQSIIIK